MKHSKCVTSRRYLIRLSIVLMLLSVIQEAVASPVRLGTIPIKNSASLLSVGDVLWIWDSFFGEIYGSRDRGTTWSKVLAEPGAISQTPYFVVEDPAVKGLLLVSIGTVIRISSSDWRAVPCGSLPDGSELYDANESRFPATMGIPPAPGRRFVSIEIDRRISKDTKVFSSPSGCGNEWIAVNTLPKNTFVREIAWGRANTVIAGFSCGFAYSINAGRTWSPSTFHPNLCTKGVDSEAIVSIQFLSDRVGFLGLGLSRLYKTKDAGRSWVLISGRPDSVVTQTSPQAPNAGAACFNSELKGWRVGHDSKLLSTMDGGKTWIEVNSVGEVSRIAGNTSGDCVMLSEDELFQLR
jgi:hypothetical protein